MTDSLNNTNDIQEENNDNSLVCQWNRCSQVFANHPALASHLSEDHVGWKKGGYFCDWNNCARQGAKCHNRFALMMHLRIHTGEKPFECTLPNCGQTFGRMDALVRHKKAEHGEESNTDIKPAIQIASYSPKRPLKTLDMLSKKRPLEDHEPKNLANGSSDYIQYRLAKAQLAYILRENEMLRDEFELASKKLKRMKTERRVLLDAVMKKKAVIDEDETETEEETEEQDDTLHILKAQ